MKILHVIVSLDPALGGPPMVVTRLAAAQAGLGHDVSVMSYLAPHAINQVQELFDQIPHGDAVKRIDVKATGKTEAILGTAASKAAQEALEDADLLYAHGVWEPILKVTCAAAFKRNIPYVTFPHGMLDPWALQQRKLKKKIALTLGWKKMLDRALFIHTLNDDEARLIKPLNIQAPQVVIPNGIFPEEVANLPAPGSFRNANPALGDAPFILFLSRLHYKKGLDYLADSFAMFAADNHDAHLVVAGPDGGAQAEFEKTISDAGLNSRVHVVGPQYGDQKLAAFQDASCFCLPSRQEGFSIAILEALATGNPVIITDACHFPEVREVNAGAVTGLDAQEVADAMTTVMGNPDVASAMSEAGQKLVRERFTWPVIAQQTIDAVQQHTSN